METTSYLSLSIKVLSLWKWDSSLMLINQDASAFKNVRMSWWRSLRIQLLHLKLKKCLWLTHFLGILLWHFYVDNLVTCSAFFLGPLEETLLSCHLVIHFIHTVTGKSPFSFTHSHLGHMALLPVWLPMPT
jgi:hypothetical protein